MRSQFAGSIILAKSDKLITAALDRAVFFLTKKKKKNYTIIREDGWRVSFQKLGKKSRRNYPITDKDIQIVKKLLKSNKTCPEIAEALGITKNRAENIVKKINHYNWIPSKESIIKHSDQVVKLRKSGYSQESIGKKIHVSRKTINFILKKHKMGGEMHSKGN